MKKYLLSLMAAFSICVATGCSSVESAKVDGSTIASHGEAVAVIQATNLGLYLLFNFIPVFESNLDTVVNKLLVTEAKALGGNKVELLTAFEMPKSGIFALTSPFALVAPAYASGVAVK